MKSLLRTKIFLVLLLACEELLKSAPKKKKKNSTISSTSGCERLPLESNPIPYREYLHLSISAFFVKLNAPNRQFCKVTLEFLVVGANL